MKISKVLSLILVVVLITSVFCTTASATVISFKPAIESGRICGIALNTPQTVLRELLAPYSVEIYNKGQLVASDSTVNIGTGFIVKVGDNLYYNAVVMGDVDGDGKITSMDYLYVKRAVLGNYDLTPTQRRAAEVKDGEEMRAISYIKVKRAYFASYDINKPYTCEPYEASGSSGDDGWSDGWV